MAELVQAFRFQVAARRLAALDASPGCDLARRRPSSSGARPAPTPPADAGGEPATARRRRLPGVHAAWTSRPTSSEYLEGGRNDGVVRRVGRVKLPPIVLKRGHVRPPSRDGLRRHRRCGTGCRRWSRAGCRCRRYDGAVEVLDPTGDAASRPRWRFVRGLPLKVVGPALNARTGEIAVEELHIAHEGLRLEATR